jgi:hypothetical protein
VVAHNADAIQRAERFQRLFRLETNCGYVAETDDLVRVPGFDISQHSFQCGVIPMDI